MYDIDQLRAEEFPLSAQTLFFNNGAIAPPPIRARDKMKWAVDKLSEHPTRFFADEGRQLMEDFNREFAALLNAANPQEIVPISTTGAGINVFALALGLQAGDNIAFCPLEFPVNAYPWMRWEQNGVQVRRVPPVEGGLVLEELQKHVDEHTKLVAVSALQFFSGHRTDLHAIGNFCRQRGILFFVDAIQCLGHMPIDVQTMGIDALAAGGQKSILGTPGVGMMYVRDAVAERLMPQFFGANATKDYVFWLDYDMTPQPGAARFSLGIYNIIGMAGMLEGLRLLRELGIAHIDRHTQTLVEAAIDLMEAEGYTSITPRQAHGSIATFKLDMDSAQADTLLQFLDARQVSVAKHLSPQGDAHLRLSFHCYNKVEEIHQFQAIIKEFRP